MKHTLKLFRGEVFAIVFLPPFVKKDSVIKYKDNLYKVLEIVFPAYDIDSNPIPEEIIEVTVVEVPKV